MIEKLHNQVESGVITFQEITSKYLHKIDSLDNVINAFVSVCRETSQEKSQELDKRRLKGEKLGVLAGIPVAVKDNICSCGVPTTCGSRMLKNFIPPYSATVIEKLEKADAIIIGKANLDEFGMGSSTETSYFGCTRNPHDTACIAGGSSGGPAASLAAEEAVVALGSDTGGSIRQPASHCGVVGLKPTYGRVSRYGLVAFASSLDQIGPLTTSVKDAARVLQVIAGHDPLDSTSSKLPVPDYLDNIDAGIKGLKNGLPKEYFGEGLSPEIKQIIEEKIKRMERAGAEIVDLSLPHLEYAIAAYYILCTAEASSNLARYDGVKYGYREVSGDLTDMYCETRKEGFGDEVKRRIMLGTYVLSSGYYDAYYLKASKARTLIADDYKRAWGVCDVIVAPVAPEPAFKVGEKINDPLQMYLSDIYTTSLNLAGLPGISVPCGKIEKLPVGIQLIGKPFDESTVLRAAYALEGL